MKIIDSVAMRLLDETAIKEYGIPGLVLMENAGRGVAQLIVREFADLKCKRIAVFAGKGNNGGDGFVAARHLSNVGFDVSVFLLAKKQDVHGDARINMDIWEKMGEEIQSIITARDIEKHKSAILHSSLIIDAIFGTGLSSEVKGIHKKTIGFINGLRKKVVAIDIPSGLDASTGMILGSCVKAYITATMALPKTGLYVYPGADYSGRVETVDIGMPRELLCGKNITRELLDSDYIKRVLRPRHENTHKGNFGHVFVLAGSTGKTGAAAMAAAGAMRAGAGLVTLGIPESLNNVMAQKLTEVMTLPLPESAPGILAYESFDNVVRFISDKKAAVLGPGLTTNPSVKRLVTALISEARLPLVIDADAINCLSEDFQVLKKAKPPVIITPHPGEMARLLGVTVKEVQADRPGSASEFARENNVIVVLKGARTIIAQPSGNIFINPTGNPGMATAGTGDVLAGMIGGFIAQGYRAIDAANLGVYLHGLAGDKVAGKKGRIGIMATDVLDAVPETINSLLQKEDHESRV